MSNKLKKRIVTILCHRIPLLILSIIIFLPFVWAFLMSIKTEQEILAIPILYLPKSIKWMNYYTAWTKSGFSLYFKNSFVISILSVFFITLFSLLNGFVLSRYAFKGKKAFMLLLLVSQLLPAIIFIIPLVITFKNLGLLNTGYSVSIFYIATQLPFNTFLMKNFIDAIPKEIDEAATIDGVRRLGIITRIIIPLTLHGIVATSSYAFLTCWNEYLVSFAFITSRVHFTLPIGLSSFMNESNNEIGPLAAGGMIALIPPVIFFGYLQKYLITGLSAGAVKG